MTVQAFADVLEVARAASGGTRPGPADGTKTKYATHFANAMAVLIANALRPRFAEIKPDAQGRGVESPAQSLHGLKKLDVNYSTAQAGLGLGVSLKSVHVRDVKPNQRFHHNMKRNDEELRAEAAGLCTAITLASTVVNRPERRRGAGHGRQWCPAECKWRSRWWFIRSTDDDRRAQPSCRAHSSCRREPGAPTSRPLVPAGRTDEWS